MNGGDSYADNAAEVSQKLNDAGAQVFIDEVQRQLDAWAAENSQQRHPDILTARSTSTAGRAVLGQPAPPVRRLESVYELQ
ncbi:MAG: hypothetical protein F4Y80_17150 [Caldilineaceae bacterium SB0665_bin_21]|nr:hypothetical protein [Caldilineaceae bacterium SB0665_bin_21]MYC63061.1 hypothetical protein [Caldilineaceae bacterium SB0661_bin_34]